MNRFDDLDPELHPIAERLERARPLPAPGFRGELRRSLLRAAARPAPKRLRLIIGAQAGGGAGLLAVAALGALGVGPMG